MLAYNTLFVRVKKKYIYHYSLAIISKAWIRIRVLRSLSDPLYQDEAECGAGSAHIKTRTDPLNSLYIFLFYV